MDRSRNNHESQGEEAASDLFNKSKKWANEVCDESMDCMNQVEKNIKECSDQLLQKIQENPLTSILIAGSIGFLLSKIMRK